MKYIAYDKNGIARVWGEDNNSYIAELECEIALRERAIRKYKQTGFPEDITTYKIKGVAYDIL
jgi:hypothetical protein